MEADASDSHSTLSPLRIGTFRDLWFASMASNFGGLIQGVGAAWLMTSIAESADMVALVQTSTTLPIMMLSLVAGAIADSFERRRVMLFAQLFMFTVSACLATAAWLGWITPWVLLGFTFLIGCGGAFHNPAWQAAVGDVVPREKIAAAVLLNSVSFNVTRSVGPALGGAIVATAGAFAAFAINTVSYLGLITVLWRWRPDLPPRTMPRENLATAMTAGVRYVAMSPNIVKVMVRGFAFGLTTIVVLALLPLVTRDLLQGDALVYGSLLGAFGVGAVAGAFISRPARERLSNEHLVRWCYLAFALSALAAAESATAWLTGAVLIVAGAAWVMALSLFNTTVQMSTPRWVVGRALSLYQMAIFGGMALGSWCWGHVAEGFSVEIALLGSAAAMLAGLAIGWWIPLPAREALNLDPLNRWQEPRTTLEIQPRSGPISISVEYLIAEADVAEFLQAMTERHRIRRRDGAYHWTLMRDMENPQLWTESFEIPTWVEYVRLHSRTTHADAHVGDRIRALHAGDGAPRVRRMLIRNPARARAEALALETPDLQH
ncbi:MAG: MFS transporter [Pseudomonadales bacterium]